MKHKRSKKINKITKASLALLVSGTVFSSTNVFAEEPMAPIEVELHMEDPADPEEIAKTEIGQQEESPSLVPGEFFYFTKILLEKIQLALTFDDRKEAKLIAEYAAERLAEAEVLFAEGDEEAALETITAAIEYMETEDAIVENQPSEKREERTDLIDVELEVEVIANDDASSEEESGAVVEDEMEAMHAQNIVALKAAMEKVKNPKAKAALQKNIDKSYAKLAKKLEKQKKKVEKKTKKESDIIDPIEVDEQESGTDVKNDEVNSSPVIPSKHKQREEAKEEKKKIKQEVKQQRHELKANAKEKKTEVKRTQKEMKKEGKGNKGKNESKGNKGNNGNKGNSGKGK